jgi:hypothetical protein
MKGIRLFLPILLLALALPAFGQEVVISEEDMVKLINSSFGKYALYAGKDIPDKDLHSLDLNGDGTTEWIVVPATACGETKNCTFFVMQYNKGKKAWQLLLMADGKTTNMTPWGFVTSPRKTKGYLDLITVFDTGPEAAGTRALERHIYVWDGKKYVEFTSGKYPPEGPTPELTTLLDQVDKLKFQRLVSDTPRKRKPAAKKKGGGENVFEMPAEMQK